jgi:NADP-dependent 3-hydroxy acid dehydrogenase YdfG
MSEKNYVEGKVVVITGASNGFGALDAEKIASRGGKPVLAARNEDKLKAIVDKIKAAGFEAAYKVTDVTKYEDAKALAQFAIDTYGAIDVLVNNAGTMPLAFFSDHEKAMKPWMDCIDVCIKGTIHCISAVYDQMMKQGRGQVINISSIYCNYPLEGAGVYQVAKSGVEILGESLRKETQGKIKVTIIKPTGFVTTGLANTVVNPEAAMSCQIDIPTTMDMLETSPGRPDFYDINNIHYCYPSPDIIADNIVHVIDQPWGISIANLTVRASGDHFIV